MFITKKPFQTLTHSTMDSIKNWNENCWKWSFYPSDSGTASGSKPCFECVSQIVSETGRTCRKFDSLKGIWYSEPRKS